MNVPVETSPERFSVSASGKDKRSENQETPGGESHCLIIECLSSI